jgi:predicted  nucleic acid-binding Zn-ribbon protein
MSGNEAIDDVNTKLDGIINKQNSQDAKLDAAANKLNEINKNASDASSNSNWAKWLGVAAVSMLAVPMIYNGIQNYQSTGDVGKALGAAVTNSDTEVNDLNMKKRADAAGTRTIGAVNSGTGAVLAQGAANQGQTNSRFENTNNGIKAGFGETASALGTINSNVTEQSRELQSLKAGLNGMNAKLLSQMADVQRAQKNAKDTLDVISNSSKQNGQELTALRQQAETANTQLEAAVKSLEAQKKTIDELKASAEKLPSSDQVTQLKAQIEAAETANREQMTALKDQQANMNKAIEELRNNAPKVVLVPQPAPAAASTTGGDAQLQSPDANSSPAAAPVVDPKDQLAQSAQP